ncbi:hypothetical protein FRB98_002099 [Tulasnella sp. 332]|nr:hypothetical protein FRB98_002099 [Tulasnella sp. 332]
MSTSEVNPDEETNSRWKDLSRQSSIDALPKGALDPVYAAKAEVLNRAIQDIGFGRYQRWLFVVTGFGWLVDNLWPVSISLILTPVVTEFHFRGPFFSLSQNIGLLVGAIVFGLGCDIWGRRVSFNSTLLLVGVFATVAAGAPGYVFLCVFASIWSIGVGGNLPVDSAIFLEFLPGTHQYLLTVLSIWWAVSHGLSQITEYGLALLWGVVIIMGVLMIVMWAIRFFVFKLYESPKYLMGRGRDAEAVEVVHKVAAFNGTTSSLTLKDLTRFDRTSGKGVDTSAAAAIKRNTEKFQSNHIKALFASAKLAWSTSLIISIWALIGLAFPLYNAFVPYYLATRGATFGDGSTYVTYRNEVIIASLGIPGAIVAGWLVELPKIGRKGALASSTLLTGVFLMLSTRARTSNQLLGWNCAYNFTSNIMYGVLYAMTPELFPTKDRGTGNGLAATANRIFGIMAPIIALEANLATEAPIWISGVLFIVGGAVALLLPLETRGKSAM